MECEEYTKRAKIKALPQNSKHQKKFWCNGRAFFQMGRYMPKFQVIDKTKQRYPFKSSN
jgi:hypothetical protein